MGTLEALANKIDGKLVLVGDSTGASFACAFAQEYYESVEALVLVVPSTGIPTFVLSILNMKLGETIMLNLIRSDIGQVTIQRSWHDPSKIPAEVTASHCTCLNLSNWGDALLAMSRIESSFNLNNALTETKYPGTFSNDSNVRCKVVEF